MPDRRRGPGRKEIGQHAADGGRAGFRLTDERSHKIVELIRAGNYVNTACRAAGISDATFRAWKNRGFEVLERLVADHGWNRDDIEDEDNFAGDIPPEGIHENDWKCVKFLLAVQKADAEGEAAAVIAVRSHFKDQWAAAMTFLERKYPDRWKRRDLREIAAVEREARADDEALLSSPAAQAMLHAALEAAALGEGELVDAEVVEDA